MDDNIYSRPKLNELKLNYIIRLILFAIILIFNCTLLLKIIWLFILLYYLYLSLSIFVIIYAIITIIPLVFIKLKKINPIIIKRFKKLSLFMSVLTIITGCSLTFILLINSLEMTDFCRECPFNLPYSYYNHIYDKYANNNLNEKKLKEQCSSRRCIYNDIIPNSEYKYEYICNYNPEKEFEAIKYNISSNDTFDQIVCSIVDKNSFNVNNIILEKNEIYKYFEVCDNLNEFYICQRIKAPKNYKIKEDFKCPKKSYLNYLISFCMLNIFFNLILSFLSWRSEYIKYKHILKLINENNNRNGNNSLNSTQHTSKIQKEEKEESFKEENIETIIVCSEENNIKKDYNSSNNLTLSNNNNQKETRINPKTNDEINENNKNNPKNDELNTEEINFTKIFNLKKIVSDENEEEKNNDNKNINIAINNNEETSSERNIVTINSL